MSELEYVDLVDEESIRFATLRLLRFDFVGQVRSGIKIEDVNLGEIVACTLADSTRVSGVAVVVLRRSVFNFEGAPSYVLEVPCDFEVRFFHDRFAEVANFDVAWALLPPEALTFLGRARR